MTSSSPLAVAVATALAAVALTAAWPIQPVEGDDMALSNGAQSSLARFAYAYMFQPGANLAFDYFGRVTGLNGRDAAGWLTLLAWWTWLALTARLVARLAPVSVAAALVLVLLHPEATMSMGYANGTILAAVFLVGGTEIALSGCGTRGAVGGAGLAYGIALWMRLDSVLALPALVASIAMRSGRLDLRPLAPLASVGVAMGVYLLLAQASGVKADALLSYLQSAITMNAGPERLHQRVSTAISFFPLAFMLTLAVGTHELWRIDRVRLLWAALAALPLLVVASRSVISPKQLFHALPPLLAVVAWGLAALPRRRAVAVLAAHLLVFQYVVGWRSSTGSFLAAPLEPCLARLDLPLTLGRTSSGRPRGLQVVLGPAGPLPTSDGGRLMSGLLFSGPEMGLRKQMLRAQRDVVAAWIGRAPSGALVLTDLWLWAQTAINAMLELNCDDDGSWGLQQRSRWRCPDGRALEMHFDEVSRHGQVMDFAETLGRRTPVLLLLARDWRTDGLAVVRQPVPDGDRLFLEVRSWASPPPSP